MLRAIALLLPALIPSWRFFAWIAPSPRIEFAVAAAGDAAGSVEEWRAFRPRPQRQAWPRVIGRLVWNPQGNATLFLIACAERFLDTGAVEYFDEIVAAVRSDPGARSGLAGGGDRLFIRLRLVKRIDDRIVRQEVFRSLGVCLTPERAL